MSYQKRKVLQCDGDFGEKHILCQNEYVSDMARSKEELMGEAIRRGWLIFPWADIGIKHYCPDCLVFVIDAFRKAPEIFPSDKTEQQVEQDNFYQNSCDTCKRNHDSDCFGDCKGYEAEEIDST